MTVTRTTFRSIGMIMTALGALTLGSLQARADLQFTAPNIAGNIFTYDLNFSTSIEASTGAAAQRLENGNFATLYDIGGLNSATLNPTFSSLFVLSQQNPGITPSGTAPTDGSLPNLTLRYIGPTQTTDQSFASILTINSTFTGVNPNGQYTGQTTKNSGVSAGSFIGAIGSVGVPGAAPATPEPGSLAMLVGAGLSGSAFMFKRRRRK
jgi:hypothetical protein